jgi:hypothetical protein
MAYYQTYFIRIGCRTYQVRASSMEQAEGQAKQLVANNGIYR